MVIQKEKVIRTETGRKGARYLIYPCYDCGKEIRVWNNRWYIDKHQGRCKSCATRKLNLDNSSCPHGLSREERKDGSCVECRKSQMHEYLKRWGPAYKVYHSAKYRAKKLGIPWAISKQYVESIWPPDNKCPILGIELSPNSEGVGPCNSSPSLDKIIPPLGYVEGNVAVISFLANSLKKDQTDPAVFRAIANWLENQHSPKSI